MNMQIGEQLSLFDEMVLMSNDRVTAKDHFNAEELEQAVVYKHHWYKKYILYFETIDGHEKAEHWQVNSDLALLEGNRVFYKDGFCYPFMKIFDSEKKALRFYMDKKAEKDSKFVLSEPPYKKGSVVEVQKNENCLFQDMFRINDIFGCKEYVKNNSLRTSCGR